MCVCVCMCVLWTGGWSVQLRWKLALLRFTLQCCWCVRTVACGELKACGFWMTALQWWLVSLSTSASVLELKASGFRMTALQWWLASLSTSASVLELKAFGFQMTALQWWLVWLSTSASVWNLNWPPVFEWRHFSDDWFHWQLSCWVHRPVFWNLKPLVFEWWHFSVDCFTDSLLSSSASVWNLKPPVF